MKKIESIIISLLLIFTFIFTLSSCGDNRIVTSYYISNEGNLIAVYDDGNETNLGKWNEEIVSSLTSINISDDGFYIVNGIKTNIPVNKTYTVTFETGFSTKVDKQIIKEGNKVTKPTLSRGGYILDGWFYNDKEWVFNEDVVKNDMTLTAHWEPLVINATMEAEPSSKKITITCAFETNSKLKDGDVYPIIRRYGYENGTVKDTSDDYKKVIFDESNTVASVEFDGLESNTKYLFKMYINYESSYTYITEIEATTLSYDDEKPIEITSKEDFKSMEDDIDGIYILKNDIDFGGDELSLFSSSAEPFKGTFNGDGHKISNVELSNTSLNYYGLFGYTKNASISNLILENVTAESNSLGSFSSGSLIGCAESTTVSNVTIKNVNYTLTVSSAGNINVGGVVGSSDKSTFTKTKIEGLTIDFTQARYKVNVGLFAGRVSGGSVGKTTIDGKEKTIVTNECSAIGTITGTLKYTSATEGYLRAGGFVGFVEGSSSIIYNSYCNGSITFTKTDSTDKFDISVGGFLGSNSGYVNISKCFAKTDLSVKASSDEVRFVSNDSEKIAAIGGFAGRLNRTIGKISDSYFTGNVEVVAKATRKASDAERTMIEAEAGKKIAEMAVGTIVSYNGISYEVTVETEYYTYDDVNDTYVLATDVDPDYFPRDKYYTKDGDDYTLASYYTPKEVEATYLVVGEMVGYTNYSDISTLSNIINVSKFESTSDKEVFDTFVKNFVNTL